MKTYKRGDNGEILMHSDTYLGEDYTSPNLMHYKYIRKERKNGRWVYYYTDPTADALEKQQDAGNRMLKAINETEKFNKITGRKADYKKRADYKQAAADWEKYRKIEKSRNGFTKENFKRNLAYDAVKILNKYESIKLKALKGLKKAKNYLKKLFG